MIFITPNVSYIKETHGINLKPLVKELPLLPNINTSNLATELISGQYYPNEANVFKQIIDLYKERTGEINYYTFYIEYDGIIRCNDKSFDISNEPLYKNYLCNIWCHDGNIMNPSFCFNTDGIMFTSENTITALTTMDGYWMREFNWNLNTGLVTLT